MIDQNLTAEAAMSDDNSTLERFDGAQEHGQKDLYVAKPAAFARVEGSRF